MIEIPLGWDVVVAFRNADPAMTHSVGLETMTRDFPADFAPIEPAFLGAATPDAGHEAEATAPGEIAMLRFKADRVGDFSLVCYVPGHAAIGQYIPVRVVDGGTPDFEH